MLTIGGMQAPVESFSCSAGSFGTIGSAEIIAKNLRGEPARDSSGRIGVVLTVENETVWSGTASTIIRSDARITITAVNQVTASEQNSAERALDVRDLAITTFGSWTAAPVAAIVRNVNGDEGRRIGAGSVGAVCRLFSTERTRPALEAVAARVAGELASKLRLLDFATDAHDLMPGGLARLEAVSATPFTVLNVARCFATEAGLVTRASAINLPAIPGAVVTIGPLSEPSAVVTRRAAA
jgi:hypothetical protein